MFHSTTDRYCHATSEAAPEMIWYGRIMLICVFGCLAKSSEKKENSVESKELNPGSEEARKAGCKCPVIDNHYGAGFIWRDKDGTEKRVWWMNETCPLHGRTAVERKVTDGEPKCVPIRSDSVKGIFCEPGPGRQGDNRCLLLGRS